MSRRLWFMLALLAACVLVFGAAGAAGAQKAKAHLTITVIGSGTVSGAGQRVSCAATPCSKTFAISPGVVHLKAVAWRTWKFTSWSHACRPKEKPVCSLRVERPSTRVVGIFAPPGAKQNPIRLGQPATVREDWILKVVSVTPRADDLVLAASNNAPDAQIPSGKQDYMVRLSVMYVGYGGDLGNGLIGWVEVVGSRMVPYDPLLNACPGTWPAPSFQHVRGQAVSFGEWHTGNVCYLIASTDADSSMLFVSPLYPPSTEYSPTVWFALK